MKIHLPSADLRRRARFRRSAFHERPRVQRLRAGDDRLGDRGEARRRERRRDADPPEGAGRRRSLLAGAEVRRRPQGRRRLGDDLRLRRRRHLPAAVVRLEEPGLAVCLHDPLRHREDLVRPQPRRRRLGAADRHERAKRLGHAQHGRAGPPGRLQGERLDHHAAVHHPRDARRAGRQRRRRQAVDRRRRRRQPHGRERPRVRLRHRLRREDGHPRPHVHAQLRPPQLVLLRRGERRPDLRQRIQQLHPGAGVLRRQGVEHRPRRHEHARRRARHRLRRPR